MARTFLLWGSMLGFLGVAAGAFGAHALKERLTPAMLETFEIAVRYQMYHALALLAVGALLRAEALPAVQWAGWSFLAGVLIFSGSLYLLVISGIRSLGMITPVGGLALLAGWLCLFIAFWTKS